MTACNRCHGWKEIEYHPRTYKTRSCTLGRSCPKMQDCPFYHTAKDRRVIDASPFKDPAASSSYKSQTPYPQRSMLSPEAHQRVAQTPFCPKAGPIGFIPSENVAYVNHINSTTDEFVLHRGISARKGLSAMAASFDTGSQPEVDPRVMQFLSRRKIKHLKDEFAGIRWEDLGSVKLEGAQGDEFTKAWGEEKEELDLAEELFDHDIPKFIGLRSKKNFGNIPETNKSEETVASKNIWGIENLHGLSSGKKIQPPVTFSSFPAFNVW